jgi:hypothetical protein
MRDKIIRISLFFVYILIFYSVGSALIKNDTEKGTLLIYFMEERVGYEEYTWEADERGYTLTVKGKLTKPIPMEIERLSIRVNRDFIPYQYIFRGSVSGFNQRLSCAITDGQVESTLMVAGHEQSSSIEIRRDAFLLPNPIFSPYIVLTKKYRCLLEEKTDLSAYLVPELEIPFSLEPDAEDPCMLLMDMGGVEINLKTDGQGNLTFLQIPSRKLRVTLNEQ